MSNSPGTDGNLFPTELKDAKVELSKLPPLNPQKSDDLTSDNKSDNDNTNNIINNSYDNSDINGKTTNIDKNDNIINNEPILINENNNNDINNNNKNNNNSNDINGINKNQGANNNTNDNTNNINGNINNEINSLYNNDSKNDIQNKETNDNNDQGTNKQPSDIDIKDEIKIGDDETDGVLQEQTNALIRSLINKDDKNSSNNSATRSHPSSKNASNSNSRHPSNSTSQKNSTKNTSTNSVRNTPPTSNRTNSSLTSHSYSSTRKTTKTALATRRIGKLPPSRISFNQEMSKIPKNILHNPYVTKRLNIFPARNTNPPKAALSPVEYRNRKIPQKDELTEKILNGEELEEEPTIEQLKNTANILRIYEKDLIDKSQYPEAKKVSEAFQKTLLKIKKKTNSNEVKTGLESLIAKRNELIILADDRKEDWDDAIAKYQSNTEAHVRDMKQQHKEKIEQFNSEIPSELTPLFKRNSVSYLTMRSNEKYLALNRHFDEAQKMKLKADEIEEMEREENFSKMDEFYRRKRDQLKQLQQLEIVNYLSYAETRKNELIFQKEKCVSAPLLRAERIDKEIKRICEKRGIKQSQLNFDLVDDERVKLIKSKEKENEEIFQHSRSNSSEETPKKSSKNQQNEEEELNESKSEEEELNENESEEEELNENKSEEEEKNEEEEKVNKESNT